MAADRDIGVAVARAWDRGAPGSGWDATAATGIRGLRLLTEAGAFDRFLFTEWNPSALALLERNLQGRPGAVGRRWDARTPPPDGPFDYVDLDPFGSPIPFVPAAWPSVRVGGIVAVTATDMLVLAGAQPLASERRYGARPVRGRLGPEGGLRTLLAYLARSARSAGRGIRPLLAYARGHYVRAYVTVEAAPSPTDPVGVIDPERWDGPPLGPRAPFGPLWLGPLFDPAFTDRLRPPAAAAKAREVTEFLDRVRGEARIPAPFYYEPNELARRLGLARPPSVEAVLERLGDRGFRAARTHVRPGGIRTDAPRAVVEDVARAAG